MRDWTKSGEGHVAECFDNADGDSMMKLYREFVPKPVIEKEKRTAQAAFLMGIPTPMPGEMVCSGGRLGCSFERLADKRSFYRAISEEPERLEEFAVRFAKMAKKLHSTPCDKAVFPSYREKLTAIIKGVNLFTDEENSKLLSFLNSIEDTGMCIHGDLHGGNVITDGTAELFIDMGDFAYGNPIFDLGALFYAANDADDETNLREYHLSRATINEFWSIFKREYFGADTPEKQADIDRMMLPVSAYQTVIWLEHDPSDKKLFDYARRAISAMK